MKKTILCSLVPFVFASIGFANYDIPQDPFRIGVIVGQIEVEVIYADGSRGKSVTAKIVSSGGESPVYQVFYVDQKGRSDAFIIDGEAVGETVKKYGKPRSRWRVPRSTGGQAAGFFTGLNFRHNKSTDLARFAGGIFAFDDFAREGKGSKGQPRYTNNGFVKAAYSKHHQTPSRQFSWQLPGNPLNQRFVLDFGRKQIVPIQVLGYQGEHAIFTLIDYRHDAKKMDAGQFYNTRVYQVEASLLRTTGDAVYTAAASQYIDDRSGLKPSDIVRANRAKVMQLGGADLRIQIGENMSQTMVNAQSVYGELPNILNIQGTMCGAVRQSLGTNYKPQS